MNIDFQREKIADGIFISKIVSDKFKSNRISVNFIAPLKKETASDFAILPLILKRGYRQCPDPVKFNRMLNSLYGAEIDYDVKKIGDNQQITLAISSIDDRYTINGEKITLEASKILCSMILDPVIEGGDFDDSVFNIEKKYLIDTIKAEINDKVSYALTRCREEMFKDSDYAIGACGTLENASELTCRRVFDAYNLLLKKAQIEIIFTGSGDFEAMSEVFTSSFTSLCDRDEPFEIGSEIKAVSDEVKRVCEQHAVVQSKLCLGFSCNKAKNDKDEYAMRFMNAIFGATPFSKLFLNVREKQSLCYYCSTSYDSLKGIILVNSGIEKENAEKVEKEVLLQLKSICDGEVTEDEFENTKKLMKNVLTGVSDSIQKLEKFFLDRIVCNQITTPDEELCIIDSLSVEDIVAAAEKVSLDTVYFMSPKEEN